MQSTDLAKLLLPMLYLAMRTMVLQLVASMEELLALTYVLGHEDDGPAVGDLHGRVAALVAAGCDCAGRCDVVGVPPATAEEPAILLSILFACSRPRGPTY